MGLKPSTRPSRAAVPADWRSLLVLGVCITVAVALLDVIGRYAAGRFTESPEDPDPDLSSTTVLDLSGALQSHAGR